MIHEAVEAIRELNKTGAPAFLTCQSSPDHKRVVADFKTLEEAQAFHRALIRCGEVARMLESEPHTMESPIGTPIFYGYTRRTR